MTIRDWLLDGCLKGYAFAFDAAFIADCKRHMLNRLTAHFVLSSQGLWHSV